MKWLKWLVGVALLIPCVVLTRVAWGLLLAARMRTDVSLPLPALALLGGFLLWLVLFILFPRPLRSYVLAHELTHALWGLIMGARISRIQVASDHGSVVLSKTNFLITLAPYFFPFYTILLIVLYYILLLFYDLESYALLWLGMVGFTWSFHVTFTINALMQHQTDVQDQGRLFSYTFIYLANIVGICLWILLVTPVTWNELAQLVFIEADMVLDLCRVVLGQLLQFWIRYQELGRSA